MENNENTVQNQEKKNKKGLSAPLVVIMLIVVLIIGIGGGYLLSKNDNLFSKNETQSNNNNNNESQIQNTSNTDDGNKGDNKGNQSISVIPTGLYQYKQKIEKDDFTIRYSLYLYDNGTFKYEHSIAAPTGAIGKYTIKDNNLILNVQYLTGSDTGITKTNETITLKINNNTIIDQNGYYKDLSKKYSNIDFNNITMVKANESDDKEYLKTYPSIEDTINNAVITDIDGTEIQKTTEYAKYYIEKIKELNYVDDSTKYGLLYVDQSDIPYLIVDTGGDLNAYKINKNTVVTLKERDSYGTHGRDGYDYIEGTNIMRDYCTFEEGYVYEIYNELFDFQYSIECTFDGQYRYTDKSGEKKIITEEEFNKLSYKNSNFKHLREIANNNKEEMIKFLEN